MPGGEGAGEQGLQEKHCSSARLGGLGAALGGERGLRSRKASREGRKPRVLAAPELTLPTLQHLRRHPSPALPISSLSLLLCWGALRRQQSVMIFLVLTPVLEHSSPLQSAEKITWEDDIKKI